MSKILKERVPFFDEYLLKFGTLENNYVMINPNNFKRVKYNGALNDFLDKRPEVGVVVLGRRRMNSDYVKRSDEMTRFGLGRKLVGSVVSIKDGLDVANFINNGEKRQLEILVDNYLSS